MKKTVAVVDEQRSPIYQNILGMFNSISKEYKNFPLKLYHLPNIVLGSHALHENAQRLSNENGLILIDMSITESLNDQRFAFLNAIKMIPQGKSKVVLSVYLEDASNVNLVQRLQDVASKDLDSKIQMITYSNEDTFKNGLLSHMKIKKKNSSKKATVTY